MRMTDNEGFDIFYLRDDNIKKEEENAEEHDNQKGELKPENKAEIAKIKKTADIIKFILLVLILITSAITMIYTMMIYYKQVDTQNIVFPQSVIGKTDSYDGIVVDTADDIDINEVITTQIYIDLSPDTAAQSDNGSNGTQKPAAEVTTKANQKNTVKIEAETTTVTAQQTTEKSDGLININFATKEQLMTLESIGESRAEAIIAYRNENGAFLSVDELLEVDGIGSGILEKNRHRITVD